MFEKKEKNPKHRRREKNYHFSGPSNDIWIRFYGDAIINVFVNSNCSVTQNSHVFVDYVLFQNFDGTGIIRISQPTSDTKVLVSTSSFINSSSTTDYSFNLMYVAMNLRYKLQVGQDHIHVLK